MSSQCKSCGASVIWVKTSTGKRMPIDEKPVPNGNLILNGLHVTYTKPGYHPTPGGKLYVSHFATCPDKAEHRRQK